MAGDLKHQLWSLAFIPQLPSMGYTLGRHLRGGVEYHLINALACIFLKLDAVLEEIPLGSPLQKQCEELKSSLLQHIGNITNTYNNLAFLQADQTEPKVTDMDVGEPIQFLSNYMKQVQCLLHIISACHHGDWVAYLAAVNNQIESSLPTISSIMLTLCKKGLQSYHVSSLTDPTLYGIH